jgi:hypothetical protein
LEPEPHRCSASTNRVANAGGAEQVAGALACLSIRPSDAAARGRRSHVTQQVRSDGRVGGDLRSADAQPIRSLREWPNRAGVRYARTIAKVATIVCPTKQDESNGAGLWVPRSANGGAGVIRGADEVPLGKRSTRQQLAPFPCELGVQPGRALEQPLNFLPPLP